MTRIIRISCFLIVLCTPFLIVTTAMRIALSPIFYSIEYNLPNFPEDSYGLTKQDRLKWADVSIKFLQGTVSTEEYSALQFPDGNPLFNEREISHMIDVRNLTVDMLFLWRVLAGSFLMTIYLGWKNKWLPSLTSALVKGAKATLILIFTILLFVWIDFSQLFTLFHKIFFTGDSWLFYLSDTLIRLFPMKFWQDLFIFIGSFCIITSLIILYLSNKFIKRQTHA
jgi:integral membrane protein (TIGR01906 family)